MKTFPLVLLAAILMSCAGTAYSQSNADAAHEALTDAQHAYIKGDLDTAKQQFKIVLELDPHNVTALNYMRMIATQEKATGQSGAGREKQLQALILPRVELKDTSFGVALDYLKQMAAKQGDAGINFVVQVPQDVVDAKKITLNLTNIPFTEVLRYMGELTSFKFVVEKYAISVKSTESSPAVTSAAPAASPIPGLAP